MTSAMPYQYVVLRCVPRVDRQEFVNVGVVVYCEEARFLDVECSIDELRLHNLAPSLDVDALRSGLRFAEAVCRGESSAGDVAHQPMGIRFGFLKAPRSTVVQPGPVHGGLTSDPAAELAGLLDRLVH
jgi:hypothetical protein